MSENELGALYLAIGIAVSIVGVYILCKVDPPWTGKPTFGDFAGTVGIIICMIGFGMFVWPITLTFGGLYLFWKVKWGDEKEAKF